MFSTPLEDAITAKIKKIDRGLGEIMSDLLKLIRNLLNKVKFLPNKVKKFIKYNLLLIIRLHNKISFLERKKHFRIFHVHPLPTS